MRFHQIISSLLVQSLLNHWNRARIRFPVQIIELRQIQRVGVKSECSLSEDGKVVVEVRHGEFANRFVDGAAKSQSRKVALGDGAIATRAVLVLENKKSMAVVVRCAEKHEFRFEAHVFQRRRRQQTAIEAMRFFGFERVLWAARRLAVILHAVDEKLDLRERLEDLSAGDVLE